MTGRFSPFKITRADTVVLIFTCLFLTAIVQLALSNSRDQEYRMACAKNLSTIGKAMQIYANDYDGKYPRAGGRTTALSNRIADFTNPNRFVAFQIASDGYGGYATISSSLYLLIKYVEVSPKTFVCPADSGVTAFNPVEEDLDNLELTQLWDFGLYPSSHYSYAYHMPYCLYPLSTSSDPGMAVAADRNPWIVSTTTDAKDFNKFNPDGDRDAVKAGNSLTHEREGQNVLFVDGHVSFETTSSCGVNDDNIYTLQGDKDIRTGMYPDPLTIPSNKTDSYLVNEPGIYKKLVTRQSREINSSDLKQTSIAPTLDCPMPENKNVIWCSTFKMAWDKMKDDIIGEPIEVLGAEELAARLNQAKNSPSDLNEDSYYATAGFVREGIVEQIQTEMQRRFPSEPIPSFEELDVLPQDLKEDAVLSYSYISVNVEFEHPFYTNEKKFAFNKTDGTSTNVTSFYNYSDSDYEKLKKVSEQVDILYYKRGKQRDKSEFAVDLSRQTQPYQVILAVVQRRASLTEIIADVEKKISEFELDPDYDRLRKLRLKKFHGDISDELIVPDVLYRLTHHFKELEGKGIGNQPWRNKGYFIFLAMQMIDFSLSRTGVVLKSEGIFGMTSAIGRPILPRYFHFNRPFLIYVKKRGTEHNPFFVMWVDNAELMNLYQEN